MDTPCWSWDKILDSVGIGKNGLLCTAAMDRQDHLKERDGK